MLTKIEGIVLSKTDYRDRDIIAHLLLRSGRKVPVIFYGGRGGGKKRRPSTIEIGYLLKVELNRSKNYLKDRCFIAKEWKPLWFYKKIREDYKAFYLLSFVVDLIEKVAVEEDLHQEENITNDQEGLFKVASNAIYYLEDSLVKGNFKRHRACSQFLAKLIFELGIAPKLSTCSQCDFKLNSNLEVELDYALGGFKCSNCSNVFNQNGNALWDFFLSVKNNKFSDYSVLMDTSSELSNELINYLSHQFQIVRSGLKGLEIILK